VASEETSAIPAPCPIPAAPTGAQSYRGLQGQGMWGDPPPQSPKGKKPRRK